MRQNSAGLHIFNLRALSGLTFGFVGVLLAFFSFAANPPSGSLNEGGSPVTYMSGPFLGSNPTGFVGLLMCNEQLPCDDFTLTVNVTTAEFAAAKNVRISVSWPNVAEDYDVYILQGGTEVARAASSAIPEVAILPAVVGSNVYTIRTVPFDAAGGTITALIEFVDKPVPPTPGTPGIAPRYHVFVPPAGMGNSAGEPSIGIGKSGMGGQSEGRAMFIAGLETLRISFDDCSSPAKDLWEDKSFATTSVVTLDPILFTDPETGRTFVSQLLGKASSIAYTDDDGESYLQSQGSGINSGVDHQTVGGGRFAPPLTRDPNGTLYPNAVYYASQDAALAQAAVSLDGGQTFGPAVPMYNLAQCAGIHGHVKVAPDGTAYVPNKSCNGLQAAVVSENNGITWEVRTVPGSTAASGIIDPAVGIGTQGRVFFGGVGSDRIPFTAVSDDKGRTWRNFQAIGADLGIKNATFSQMIAGDNDRAAFAFLGTTTGGNYQIPMGQPGGFKGTWHLYVSTTYDGGVTWTTINATPNDPVQQGSICNSGTTCVNTPNDRNLLDFNDIQIDKEGRVLVSFADGCISSACIQGLDQNGDGFKDNDFSARATVARQSGGRRLLAAFDPNPEEPNPPAAPLVNSVVRDTAGVVVVRWSVPDHGGAPITGYNVYRKEGAAGTYARLGGNPTVAGDRTFYEDNTAASEVQYFYKVTALNSEGEGPHCGEFEVGLPPPPIDPCILPGIGILQDQAGDIVTPIGQTTNPAWDLRSLSIAEPFGFVPDKMVFTVKVESLATVPPNTRWPVQFTVPGDPPELGRWVEMRSIPDAQHTGPVSFRYGTFAINTMTGAYGAPATIVGDADAESTYTPDGNIRIVVSRDKIGNPAAGPSLLGFLLRVRFGADAGAVTPDNMLDSLAPSGSYAVVGNAFCRPNAAPIAALTATPQSGPAPLEVALNAAGSVDPDSGDTVVAYKFNFGDGTPPVTQMNDATIDHTYSDQGTYRATVQVTDSRGKVSENVADVLIDVTSLLQSVVSRKMHGAAGEFDIELPTSGAPGIECRTGGKGGDYRMVFTFADPVTGVGSASTSGTQGSPSGSGVAGPNANQYTVNLTGVENDQFITVTLDGVQTGGTTLNNVQGMMGVLVGDTTANSAVNSSDIGQTKAQSGQATTASNFRLDVTTSGSINSSDIGLVKTNSGTNLP